MNSLFVVIVLTQPNLPSIPSALIPPSSSHTTCSTIPLSFSFPVPCCPYLFHRLARRSTPTQNLNLQNSNRRTPAHSNCPSYLHQSCLCYICCPKCHPFFSVFYQNRRTHKNLYEEEPTCQCTMGASQRKRGDSRSFMCSGYGGGVGVLGTGGNRSPLHRVNLTQTM